MTVLSDFNILMLRWNCWNNVVTLMVTEMLASVTISCHSIQNMTIMMMLDVIKKNNAIITSYLSPLMTPPLNINYVMQVGHTGQSKNVWQRIWDGQNMPYCLVWRHFWVLLNKQADDKPNNLKCCMEINYPKDKMLKVCYIHITRFRVKQFIHTK